MKRRRHTTSAHARQRGIALITVVFVITLATIISMSLVTAQSIAVSRTGNLLQGEQALWYSTGVENWAAQILVQDRKDSEIDSLDEIWAFPVDYLPIEGGFVSGALKDQHGLFNINDLVSGDAELVAEQLVKLLGFVTDPPATEDNENPTPIRDIDAASLVQAIADWVDEDIDPRIPGGAEDDYYLGLETPYRTANQPMASISELRLVQGMTEELYLALAPLITALPAGTMVNVNTAPPEVLAALVPDMSLDEANALVSDREEEPFDSVETFMQHEIMAGREVDDTRFTVASEFFLLNSQATVGNTRIRQHSLLHRDPAGVINVVGHSQYEF